MNRAWAIPTDCEERTSGRRVGSRAYYTARGPPVFEARVRLSQVSRGAQSAADHFDLRPHQSSPNHTPLIWTRHESGARSCNASNRQGYARVRARFPTPSFTDAPLLVRIFLYAHVTSPWQLSSTIVSPPSCLDLFLSLCFVGWFRHAAIMIARYRVSPRQTSWERPGPQGSITRASGSRSMFGNIA